MGLIRLHTRRVPRNTGPRDRSSQGPGGGGFGVLGTTPPAPPAPEASKTNSVASGCGVGYLLPSGVSRDPQLREPRGEKGGQLCRAILGYPVVPTLVLPWSSAVKSRAGTGWDKQFWKILAYWESLMVGEGRGQSALGRRLESGGDRGPGLAGISERAHPLTSLHPFEEVLKASLGLGALRVRGRRVQGRPGCWPWEVDSCEESAADAAGSVLKPQEAWGRRRDKSTQTFLPFLTLMPKAQSG